MKFNLFGLTNRRIEVRREECRSCGWWNYRSDLCVSPGIRWPFTRKPRRWADWTLRSWKGISSSTTATRVLHPESHAGVDSGRCTRRRHADPREERGPILPGQIYQLSSDPDRGTEIFGTATGGLGAEVFANRIKRLVYSHSDHSFERWVESRFGKTLYYEYFKPFTKKVWGTTLTNWIRAGPRAGSRSIRSSISSSRQRRKISFIATIILRFIRYKKTSFTDWKSARK